MPENAATAVLRTAARCVNCAGIFGQSSLSPMLRSVESKADEIAVYGSGRRYPPCEVCGSGGWPSDYVLEEPGQVARYVCWECAILGFRTGGRFDLAMEMDRQHQTMLFLRRDPKSPSFRANRMVSLSEAVSQAARHRKFLPPTV